MNELEYQEEWLSAYLDDELTDAQRQVVEQRLATDPAAQATLEDLQRVRSMVAKLPSWTGPDLKFAVPAALPSSDVDELDDSNELNDFEAVPRVIAGTHESRVTTKAIESKDLSSRSLRSVLGWVATAASVLLVAGLGYMYWPTAIRQVATLETAPTMASKASTRTFNAETDNATANPTAEDDFAKSSKDMGLAFRAAPTGEATLGEDTLERLALGSPDTLSRAAVAEKTDPARIADKKESTPQPDAVALERKQQAIELPPESGGIGGARSLAEPDMNGLAANAPTAAAELPPPGPANRLPMASEGSNVASAKPSMGNAPQGNMAQGNMAQGNMAQGNLAQGNALTSPSVFYARSQSWMDEETQSTLLSSAQQNRADHLAFGSNSIQRRADPKNSGAAAEGVLMAAIKPEVANSPNFFQEIVASNQLVEVDQRPVLNQLALADPSQAGNSSLPPGRIAGVTDNVASATESANSPTSNMFSNRYPMATPNQPQGNSFVLFLNRDEANQILNQLQEKGQVSSQVWRVVKQQDALANSKEVGKPASELQTPQSQRGAISAPDQNPESVANGRVILLLNSSPN